jgi:hypothetical protein
VRGALLVVIAGCSFVPRGPDRNGPPDGTQGSGSDAGSGSDGSDAPPAPTSPRLLTIHDPLLTQNISGVPVLIKLDSTRIDYAQVTDPKTQLRFNERGGSDLPFEVLSWDPAGTSEVWIEVSSLSASQPTLVDMFFGSGANGHDDPVGTWSNGYKVVEHFGPNLVDSTGKHAPATLGGSSPTVMPGVIGTALHFAGGDGEELDLPGGADVLSAGNAFMLDFWIYPDYATPDLGGAELPIFDKGASVSKAAVLGGSALAVEVDFAFTNGLTSATPLTVPGQQWTDVAWVYDHTDQHVRFFVNGVEQSPPDNIGNTQLETDASPFAFGVKSSVPVMTGSIDEFRVGTTAHTSSFMHAQYMASSDQLVTYSAE